jgi:1-acyl-sn-glycerol-3-phosphate acyltransferase
MTVAGMSEAAIYVLPSTAGWRASCAYRALRLCGWQIRFDGQLPTPRGVIIAYPHTSNWDFFIGLATIWALELPIRWVGKETLFTGWFGNIVGPLLRRWGGSRFHPKARAAASIIGAQAFIIWRSVPRCRSGWHFLILRDAKSGSATMLN